MDGHQPFATTCLFQSPIVWHSVMTVFVASQQPVSCVCYPPAHKRKKRIHGEKKEGHVFPPSQHVSFHRVKLLVSHFPLSHIFFFLIHDAAEAHAEWEMFGWHGNSFPKWNKCLAAFVLSNRLWSDGTPIFFSFSCNRRLWLAVVGETLDLNALL